MARASVPADALLAADAGMFLALGGQNVAVAGVGIAPAQGACTARVCMVWLGFGRDASPVGPVTHRVA